MARKSREEGEIGAKMKGGGRKCNVGSREITMRR